MGPVICAGKDSRGPERRTVCQLSFYFCNLIEKLFGNMHH